MIVTRCPACQSAFRVTPEQLRAGSGRVRCGKCRTVFNALESLIYRADPHPTVAATARPTPAPPFAVPPEEETPPAAAEREAPPDAPEHETTPLPRLEDTVAAPDAAPVSDLPEAPGAFIEDEAPQSPIESAPPRPETPRADENQQDVTAETRVDVPPPLSAAESRVDAPPPLAAAQAPGEAQRTSLFEPEPSPSSSRTKTVGLILAILVALAGLSAQAVYVFREDLAMRYPQWRPQLEQWCRSLGCEIPLPHRADLMALESSELQPDPERPGLLLLSATVRNRAPFVQAYPHLELTLTDTRDQPLLRRVFSPTDYLPKEADRGAGLAAHRDVTINLWLDPGEAGAAGYRLYVFYP